MSIVMSCLHMCFVLFSHVQIVLLCQCGGFYTVKDSLLILNRRYNLGLCQSSLHCSVICAEDVCSHRLDVRLLLLYSVLSSDSSSLRLVY